jgi:hypothetical protein
MWGFVVCAFLFSCSRLCELPKDPIQIRPECCWGASADDTRWRAYKAVIWPREGSCAVRCGAVADAAKPDTHRRRTISVHGPHRGHRGDPAVSYRSPAKSRPLVCWFLRCSKGGCFRGAFRFACFIRARVEASTLMKKNAYCLRGHG